MTKSLVVAALISTFAVASFAQASAPMADGASAPAKKHHMKHAKKPIVPATDPNASNAKTGDGK